MPNDPRWLRIQELFDTAQAWPPAERDVRLAGVEPDSAVRAEVLDLLTASEQEAEAARRLAPVASAEALPSAIGPFRVLRLAGVGGRGRVFEAVREAAGAGQRAAVKVMLEHLISPGDLARFEREQRVLLSLDHPAIARFLDAGWDASGRPYLAMEWVDGVPLDEWRRARQPDADECVSRIIELLDALQNAHRSLVVHLDLKPSNVMVNAAGRLRILDFGTAKLLREEENTSTLQLTPRYASPEQLRGEAVTTACDIYSAALLLHELIAGRLPFVGGPSLAALGERAAGRAGLRLETGKEDLDAILTRALDHDPAARYPSAADFAADLQAFLDRRPVSARRPTVSYRLRRFVARHPAGAALSASAFAVCLALAVYAGWQQHLRNREAERSRQIAAFLRTLITSSAVANSGRPAMTVVEMVERGNRRLEQGAGLPDDVAAAIQTDFAYLLQEFGREDLAEPVARAAISRADRASASSARIQARATLARLLQRRGQCPEVRRLLDESGRIAEAARPGPADEMALLLARSAAAEGCEANPGEALGYIQQALRAAEAIPPREELVPPALRQASLHLQHSLLLSRAGRSPEALQAAGRGLELAASHPDGRYFQVALLRIRSMAFTSAGRHADALADIRQAAQLAPGVVNPFEEVRLQTLTASRMADAGDPEGAVRLLQAAVAEARSRQAVIGPSYWMIHADAAEVLAKCRRCAESREAYREVDALTQGQMPRTWRGNRLFYEAECALPADPARAARLAREALATYGELLPAVSTRRARLEEILTRSR